MKKLIEIQTKVIAVLLLLVFISCTKEQDEDINKPDDFSNLSDTTLINVPYGGHIKQVYDIYLPAKRDTATPVVLMIHGGGWKEGQKEDLNNYLNRIKTKWEDVALVNMNYRLASNDDNIHHNEIMADIGAVVSDLISKMDTYQISSKIGVIGASAGGHLAMIYAYKYDPNIKCIGNIFGPSIINDWSWYNSNNPWLGGYTGDILTEYVGQPWDTIAYKAVSPYWNISSTSQPTIIFHGSLDPVVPVYQSQWMHGKLNSLGVINEYHEYIAFHSFDNNQSDEVITKLVVFFKQHIE